MYVYTLLKKSMYIYTPIQKCISIYFHPKSIYIYTLIQKVCTETVQHIYYFICSTKHMYDSCHASAPLQFFFTYMDPQKKRVCYIHTDGSTIGSTLSTR